VAGLLSRAISSIGQMISGDDDEDRECPDPCGVIEKGSIDTFIGPEKLGAAVVDEDAPVPCENHSDGPIIKGAAHVWVNHLRWARRTDELDCGALVGEGIPTVLIGAPSETAERRDPTDTGSWLEQTVLGALASSGRFGRLEASFGAQLGAVCAGARRMSAAEIKAQLDSALSGAAGPELARRIAAGDPWAVREALIR